MSELDGLSEEALFGELRSALQGEASPVGWARVCEVMDVWPRVSVEERAVAYASSLLDRWPDVYRSAPWRWVQRVALGAELPMLELVRVLDLRNYPIRGSQLDKVLRSEVLQRRVSQLYIDEKGFGVEHAPLGAMLAATRWQRLESLYLDRSELGDRGARVLADAPWMATLRELSVERCWLTLAGLKPLLGATSGLKVLDLGGNPVKRRDVEALELVSAHVEALSLDWCAGREEVVDALCEQQGWGALRELDLAGLELRAEQMERLASWSGLECVERLRLCWSAPGRQAWLVLGEALGARGVIKELDVRHTLVASDRELREVLARCVVGLRWE
jgi:hypothetical protein